MVALPTQYFAVDEVKVKSAGQFSCFCAISLSFSDSELFKCSLQATLLTKAIEYC